MPVFWLEGEVYPPEIQATVSEMTWTWPKGDGTSTRISTKVDKGRITVECETATYDNTTLNDTHAIAKESARNVAEILAFKWGVPLSVRLSRFKDPVGNESTLLEHFDGHAPSDLRTIPAQEMLDLTIPGVMLIISDINHAHDSRYHPAIYYARAVESIRHLIAPIGTEAKAAWPLMQRALNVTAEYMQYITERSKAPRHGQIVIFSEEENNEMRKRSVELLRRYLALEKSHADLGGPEFPKL